MKLKFRSLLLFSFFLLASSSLFAQKYTGTLLGVLKDPTGAVVPSATVTVRNPATDSTRVVKTNSSGEYTVTELPAGTYDVEAKAGGFKESITRGVEVNVASNTTANVTLQPGGATEVITVEANAVQVETSTGAVGTVVNGTEIRELPLNGRSFAQLTQLMPGVSAAANFDPKNKGLLAGVDFSVNGNNTTANLFLVDGANNNDVGSNRTILIYPSIDSIQEFKMLRNSYGPEYGQAQGAVINIATKGGTNQFHGDIFYFGRNSALNATDFFSARTNQKAPLQRNDYGFTFGGPFIKDKFFFFYSQEWNKEYRGTPRFGSVPTAAQRAGDFRKLRPDPRNPGQFCDGPTPDPAKVPGGVITTLDPAGVALTRLYPLPNIANPTDCNNWSAPLKSPINFREESARVDYNVTHGSVLTVRYTHDRWTNKSPNSLGEWGDDAFPAVDSAWVQPSWQWVAKLSQTLGSTSVNDFQFSYSHNNIDLQRGGTDPTANDAIDATIPPYYPFSQKASGNKLAHPTFWGGIAPFTNNTGNNIWTSAPWSNNEDLYTFRDDFSKVIGTHSFKVGFLTAINQKNEETGGSSAAESVQFWGSKAITWGSGASTGNGFADILLPGTHFGFSESQTEPTALTRWRDFEYYFGDSWKARSNLTLEYGFRWSFLREPFSASDSIATFEPSAFNPARTDSCNGMVVVPGTHYCEKAGFLAGVPGPNRSLKANNNHMIAPRLGVAWDPWGTGKTSFRAGVGEFFQRERLNVPLNLAANPPFSLSAGGDRTLDQPPTAGTLTASGSPSRGSDMSDRVPYSWQWNLTVNRELAHNTTLEVGYVGNRGLHLTRFFDINQVPVANRFLFATCGQGAPAPCPANTNSLRPFGAFGTIGYSNLTGGSNYHSLQTLFRTRIRRLDAQASYTWSKSLSDTDITNSGALSQDADVIDLSNPRLNYGPSKIDRPHIFSTNIVYNLPDLAGYNAFARNAVGGWELSTINSYSSGPALSVYAGSEGLPGNNINGTGDSQTNARPNRVPGQPCFVNVPNTREQMLNPNGWTLNNFQIGTNGNSGTGICHGPGIAQTDFAMYKNFNEVFGKKHLSGMKMQFRLEFFNLLNKTQFRADSINLNLASSGCQGGTAGCSGTNPSLFYWNPTTDRQKNFGQASATRGPREIQYALKFIF